MTYQDLSWYTGDMKQGFRHGNGSMYVLGGPQLYSGNWITGKKHGNGWMLYGENNWYEGEWRNSLRHGKGIREYASGSRYCGDWKDGKQHGFGYMVWANGDVRTFMPTVVVSRVFPNRTIVLTDKSLRLSCTEI